MNQNWSEDRVYLEARRIVQAEYQHIVYSEWLPLLLGKIPIYLSIISKKNCGKTWAPRRNI
jgi:hypothetical protein